MKGVPMGGMMKQIQKMQENIAKAQEELIEIEVSASSGGGMVTVTANGRNEILEIKINPEVIDPNDVEMLEDLIFAAVNEAMQKASEAAQQHISARLAQLKNKDSTGKNRHE